MISSLQLNWSNKRTLGLKHLSFSKQLYCVDILNNQQRETCVAVSLLFSHASPASGFTDKTNRWRCSRCHSRFELVTDLETRENGLDYVNSLNISAPTSRTQSNNNYLHLWTVWKSIITAYVRVLRITRRAFVCEGRNRKGQRQNISWWFFLLGLSDLLGILGVFLPQRQ